MSRFVGVVRDAASLGAANDVLNAVAGKIDDGTPPNRDAWEATNVLTVATAVVAAATARTESRGCHRRSDFPDPVEGWRRHLDVSVADDGAVGIG